MSNVQPDEASKCRRMPGEQVICPAMGTSNGSSRYERALSSLRRVRYRPEVRVSEAPAPLRLAPHAVALNADVVDHDEDLASGRLVILHDPAGQPTWEGDFRVIAFIRATLEPEMAADPLLAHVGWSWLTEALAECGADHHVLSGTVTRVTSEAFASLADRPIEGQIEIRCSWTPEQPDLIPHVSAWAAVLAQAAGLPPIPAGVTALPRPRR